MNYVLNSRGVVDRVARPVGKLTDLARLELATMPFIDDIFIVFFICKKQYSIILCARLLKLVKMLGVGFKQLFKYMLT